jgi:hypothetical protein
MLSTRTIAVIGALAMVTATAAHAQGKDKHHAKDDDDEDDDDTARAKARAKAKAKAKARDADDDDDEAAKPKPKPKAKAKAKDADDEDERPRPKAKAKAKDADDDDDEAARARAKAKAKEAEKEAEKETETASATAASGGADEAYHDGTLGFSIPFTVIAGAVGGAGGEAVPTVDVVYFLDDKTALDLIVGLNFHRKQVAAVMGGAAYGYQPARDRRRSGLPDVQREEDPALVPRAAGRGQLARHLEYRDARCEPRRVVRPRAQPHAVVLGQRRAWSRVELREQLQGHPVRDDRPAGGRPVLELTAAR